MVTPRRPRFRITLLITLVLIITVLSAIRLYTAFAWKGALDRYLGPQDVLYIGITGAVWTLAGLFVLWSLWRGRRYTQHIILGAALVYAAWTWADRLILQTSLPANWPFALVGTIVLLAFVAYVVLDPRNQPYFRKETYDRKPEEPTAS